MKPYKVLCKLLFKTKDFLSFFTGSKAFLFFLDEVAASINADNFLKVFDLFEFNLELLSFSRLEFAKGDSLDCKHIKIKIINIYIYILCTATLRTEKKNEGYIEKFSYPEQP